MKLAFIFRKLGRESEALPWFQAAHRAEPGDPLKGYNLALSLEALGRAGEAAGVLETCLTDHPGFTLLLFQLGVARTEEGRPAEAAAAFRKVLELQPGHAEAARRLKDLTDRPSPSPSRPRRPLQGPH